MEIRINRKTCSSNSHFPFINQWNEEKTKMTCTIYAPFISLDYNSNVSNKIGETEEKIENVLNEIIDEQINKWLLNLKHWWKWSDWVEAIENKFNANIIVLNRWKDRSFIKSLLNKWIALTIWIKVDIDYLLDGRDDGKLNDNWKQYTDDKTFGHFTTLVGSNDDVVKFDGKYAIIDSYAFSSKWEWIYSFDDIDWFLDNIAMSTIYLLW